MTCCERKQEAAARAEARAVAARAERESLWGVTGEALALASVDVADSVESTAAPCLHVELVCTARAAMAQGSSLPRAGLAASLEGAERRLLCARNDIAESVEKSEEGGVDGGLRTERDEALRAVVERSQELLDAWGDAERDAEKVAAERLRKLREELIGQAESMEAALRSGVGACAVSEDHAVTHDVVLASFLERYDGWLAKQRSSAQEGRAGTEAVLSELAGSLTAFAKVITLRKPAAELPPTKEVVERLAGVLERQRRFFAGASAEYVAEVQPHALAASSALVAKLKHEALSLAEELDARERAKRSVAMGADARTRLLAKLDGLEDRHAGAYEEFEDAKIKLERLQKRKARTANQEAEAERAAEEGLAAARNALAEVRREVRRAWTEVLGLAAGPFPELLQEVQKSGFGEMLQGVDVGAGGKLFCPCSRLEQFKALEQVSTAGVRSRHNVWKALVSKGGAEEAVALKEFPLGAAGSGGATALPRTVQREIGTLARLEHPNVIAVKRFFLQQDAATGALRCFVRFPWYAGGDFGRWLETEEAKDAAAVKRLLLDALRGLEHVHYHEILHGDVKAENVLLTEAQGRSGLRRAVLADFDLSLDQQQRRAQLSQLSSVSLLPGGARGTPGPLTLAPEVTGGGGGEPSRASDMYSFGGLALLALHREQAERWQARAAQELWDGAGRASVEGVAELVAKLLQREPTKRPSASEALADELFAALGVAEQQEAAEKMAAVVAEQQRLREEEAQLAAAMQAQLEALRTQEQAVAAAGESVAARKQRDQAALREQREALEKRAKVVADRMEEVAKLSKARVPPYWKHTGEGFFHLERNSFVVATMQSWIRETVFQPHSHQCPSSPASPLLKAKVTKVLRVENETLWRLYETKKAVLKSEYAKGNVKEMLSRKTKQPSLPSVELSADVNELFLFHGTSDETAMTIARHGFDERVANLGGLYGAGSYFADNSCKSHQYASRSKSGAGEHVLLLCRVTMGWPLCTTTGHEHERRPPENPAILSGKRPFDSIFAESGKAMGGRQFHNEFVIFDKTQVYPEYVIYYTV